MMPPIKQQREAHLPATHLQEEWFHSSVGSASNDSVTCSVDIVGPLDRAILHEALAAVVDRHEALRTSLSAGATSVVQILWTTAPVELIDIDLTRTQEPGREFARLATRALEAPFSLPSGPLWQAHLARFAPQRHVLHLTLHHSIFDAWSAAILLRDLSHAYTARADSQPENQPGLPVQLGDYAAWERAHRDPPSEAYWRDRLTPLPALPLIAAAPSSWSPGQPFRSAARPFPAVPPSQVNALRQLAHANHLTLGTALQALVALTVSPSPDLDLTLGILHANRSHRELRAVVGPLIDHLVLRIELPARSTFLDLLRHVGVLWADALNHRLPLGSVIRAISAHRHPYDVSLNYIPAGPNSPAYTASSGPAPVTFSFYPFDTDAQDILTSAEISVAPRFTYVVRPSPSEGLEGCLFVNAAAVPEALAGALRKAFVFNIARAASEPQQALSHFA